MTPEMITRQKALYQLSQNPAFQEVIDIIDEITAQFAAPMPMAPDQVVAWDTSCKAQYTAVLIKQTLFSEIANGERLTRQEQSGEEHAEATGHNGRDERRRC